jgi:hypothetical protein
MSITKFLVIQCDVQSCGHKTQLLDFDGQTVGCDDAEEGIRAAEGFSFVDHPFKDQKDLYICKKCLIQIFGKPTE